MISREDVPFIVWSKPVDALLFVGGASRLTLASMGIHTIGQLATAPRELLSMRLGKMGEQILDYANGLDESPVASIYEAHTVKSVGNGMTFRRDLLGEQDARLGLQALSEEVAMRLRRAGLKCRTVQLTIKDPSLRVITRQKRLERPTHLSRVLEDTCMELLLENWDLRKPIRMLTVTGQNLVSPEEEHEQLELFDEQPRAARNRRERLEQTPDAIRKKYGRGAIHSAGLMDNDLGISLKEEEED